ncbi:MAG: fibronectin type III domain-containing protein [Candidatus Brocadiaceae bacterium]|nr:fibronectin type III domain-containing protein [Candidatus Brocadiaceae bacterium]
MKRQIFMPPLLLAAMISIVFSLGPTASANGKAIELDEAEVFIEWNSTDTDYGIQFFWDSGGFTSMKIKNESGKPVLDVKTKKNVKEQGLTEGFFESVEPPASELSMEEFLERFPEGEYTFRGKSIEGNKLVGEANLTHTLPAPPENLSPEEGDVVSNLGFTASFDPVLFDTDGNPIDIEFYEVVVEKEEDDPILQVFSVILRPTQTSVFVPAEFLEPGTEYKMEVIAQEESGNRTIAEVGTFTTNEETP